MLFFLIIILIISGLKNTEGKKMIYMLSIINPFFVIFNVLSYLIYYLLTFNDFFYSDIKSLEITRFPEAYCSVLDKIQSYKGKQDYLPKEFYYLYFIGENSTSSTVSPPQPLIELRKDFIKSIMKINV